MARGSGMLSADSITVTGSVSPATVINLEWERLKAEPSGAKNGRVINPALPSFSNRLGSAFLIYTLFLMKTRHEFTAWLMDK